MDIQKLIDTINASNRETRSNYQITISEAIGALSQAPANMPISYEDGKAPGKPMSYRGYYSDLAFSDVESATVADVLSALNDVHNKTMIGYKGGNFLMDDTTPIWRSDHGAASGVAWTGIVESMDAITIKTKQVD